MTALLLRHGADPDDNESVYHAVEAADPACLRLLLEAGATVARTNALANAFGRGRPDVVALLLEHLPAESGERRFALHWAIRAGETPETVRLLAAAGADLEAYDDGAGRTPYGYAIRQGRGDLAETLRELGAEPRVGPLDALTGACLGGDRGRGGAARRGRSRDAGAAAHRRRRRAARGGRGPAARRGRDPARPRRPDRDARLRRRDGAAPGRLDGRRGDRRAAAGARRRPAPALGLRGDAARRRRPRLAPRAARRRSRRGRRAAARGGRGRPPADAGGRGRGAGRVAARAAARSGGGRARRAGPVREPELGELALAAERAYLRLLATVAETRPVGGGLAVRTGDRLQRRERGARRRARRTPSSPR